MRVAGREIHQVSPTPSSCKPRRLGSPTAQPAPSSSAFRVASNVQLALPFFAGQGVDAPDIGSNVGFSFQSGRIHVAHLAEDGPLRPGPVVQPEYPADIGIGVSVA